MALAVAQSVRTATCDVESIFQEAKDRSNMVMLYYNEPGFLFLAPSCGIEAKHASIVFCDRNNKNYVLKCEMNVHETALKTKLASALLINPTSVPDAPPLSKSSCVVLARDVTASKTFFPLKIKFVFTNLSTLFDIPITIKLTQMNINEFHQNIFSNTEFKIYEKSYIKRKNIDLIKIEKELTDELKRKWLVLPYNVIHRNCQHLACEIFEKYSGIKLPLPNEKDIDAANKNAFIKWAASINADA